jgi:integrase
MGKLNALKVDKAGPGMHADGDGLYLQVGQNGGRSWLYRYTIAGKERYLGLGSVKDISLRQAREKAADARKLKSSGVDPLEAKRSQRASDESGGVTFSQAADKYIAAHETEWKNRKHRQQWRNTISTYATPIIGNLPVASIDTAAVMKVLEPIWTKKPETASRVRGRIEVILDWAKVQGLRNGENPARWKGHLDHLLASKSKIRKVRHHPALPYEDIPMFMAALRQRTSHSAMALELLILTATRAGETAGAMWPEIDLPGAIWEIPPERMKADRTHRVPLTPRAIAILGKLTDRSGPVFPAIGRRHGKPFSEAALSKMLALMGDWKDKKGNRITVHGFRSTFRDWVAEKTDFQRELAEVAIAHTVGDETERSYQRGDLFNKRRKLMDAWEAYCLSAPDLGRDGRADDDAERVAAGDDQRNQDPDRLLGVSVPAQ